MRKLLLLLVFAIPALAQIEISQPTYEVEIREHQRGGKVWMYEVDGERVTVGSELFTRLSGLSDVHWEKAVGLIYVKKNGKFKVKLKKKNTVLDYDDFDKKTLKELLKDGYLIQVQGGNPK